MTPKETIGARVVVNAAGPWADRLGRMVGLNLPLKLELIEEAVIRVEAPDTYPIHTPSVYDFVNGLSFRPEGTGHTVVAEGSSYFKGALDPDGYPTKPSDRYIEDVSVRLARAMPRLESGSCRGGWAGLLEGTPDFHPVMGWAPGLEGFVLCYGFSGHGFKEAPVTGRLIAELILDGTSASSAVPCCARCTKTTRSWPESRPDPAQGRDPVATQPAVKGYDAIVIGAGHNGLTAAAYLARAGLSTLVLERRDLVGGCCVTEEIAPGCRASTTSYIASMLRPEVIRDLDLGAHGLRMVPCEPGLQIALPEGETIPWWSGMDRTLAELRRHSPRDAETFARVDARLKKLARYLQPYFLEPPPDVHARGLGGLAELLRTGRRFYGISGDEIAGMVSFMTGSLGDFLDRHYESEKIKRLILANNVYGAHSSPYRPGTALGLLFHLLSGGEHGLQGFYGHVLGATPARDQRQSPVH